MLLCLKRRQGQNCWCAINVIQVVWGYMKLALSAAAIMG